MRFDQRPWLQPTFLPELEIVRCESYDSLREEHLRLVDAYYRPSAPRLRHSYGVEDEFVEEAERAGTTTSRPITPPTVRRDRIAEAEAADADSLRAVCAHVARTVAWIFGGESSFDPDGRLLDANPELSAALKTARAKAGLVESEDELEDPVGSAAWISAPSSSTIEEFNAKSEREAAQRRQAAARPERRALGHDLEALSTLRQVRLSAKGANVLAEVQRACPGIAADVAAAGAFGAELVETARAA